MSTTDDTNAARRGSGSNDLLGLLARLRSLKVLLGTDSPEVRGWAPVVQQGAQATVNAAIAALKKRCQQGQHPPLTAWETQQLIYAWLERERMRRALHEIAEEWAGAECGEPVHAQEAYAIGLAKRMYALAVEGLTPNASLSGGRRPSA